MTRFCTRCGRRRSAALQVCPDDGAPLNDVELTPLPPIDLDAGTFFVWVESATASPVTVTLSLEAR